ncbi:MAG: ABC transporter permease, partial [bacterium]
YLMVKVKPDNIKQTLSNIENVWSKHAPDQPFEYTFYDKDFDRLYRADRRVGSLFETFSFLGIFIACLGLFGLASFATEQRTKEIGVRKVLGASVPNIVMLLSKEFTKLVALAFLFAIPVSYFGMNYWLQNFAYRTEISIFSFLFAGILAIAIAWLTVSYQSIKASVANPVQALKYE